VEGNPVPFAVVFTLGNVLALGSSMFLCGPKRQFQRMMDETRKTSSVTFLVCLVLTLVLLPIPMEKVIKMMLITVLVLFQFAAGLWYNLSYIPYGRRTFCKILKKTLGVDDDGSS